MRSMENVHDLMFKKKHSNKMSKGENESAQFYQEKTLNRKQHPKKKENDSLYMIPNQRQR